MLLFFWKAKKELYCFRIVQNVKKNFNTMLKISDSNDNIESIDAVKVKGVQNRKENCFILYKLSINRAAKA